jgi:hypothetical protein
MGGQVCETISIDADLRVLMLLKAHKHWIVVLPKKYECGIIRTIRYYKSRIGINIL